MDSRESDQAQEFLEPGAWIESLHGGGLDAFLKECWGRRCIAYPDALARLGATGTDLDALTELLIDALPEAPAELLRCVALDDVERARAAPDDPVAATAGEAASASADDDAPDWPPEDGRTWLLHCADLLVPELATLRQGLQVTPEWQLDDPMVSFCAGGAGVGPHADRYDVFLVQIAGRKRWHLGADGAAPDGIDAPLTQAPEFESVRSEVATPGHVLYVPPGTVHWGVALEPSITVSIGFRAPAVRDLLALLAATAGSDRPVALPVPGHTSGGFGPRELHAIRSALTRWIEAELPDEALITAVGTTLSESRYDPWLQPGDGPAPTGEHLYLDAAARLAWASIGANRIAVFVAGEPLGEFTLNGAALAALQGGAALSTDGGTEWSLVGQVVPTALVDALFERGALGFEGFEEIFGASESSEADDA